uniref:Uncharacterized protein n=1 Tax=Rhizophora mucronata TaxID=61149 RepID=A0A2P2QQ34_RHIMU
MLLGKSCETHSQLKFLEGKTEPCSVIRGMRSGLVSCWPNKNL